MNVINRLDRGVDARPEHGQARTASSTSWTLRNIDPEIINFCKHAARQRGQRLGAWVAETLAAASSDSKASVHEAEIGAELAALRQCVTQLVDEVSEVKTNTRIANKLLASK